MKWEELKSFPVTTDPDQGIGHVELALFISLARSLEQIGEGSLAVARAHRNLTAAEDCLREEGVAARSLIAALSRRVKNIEDYLPLDVPGVRDGGNWTAEMAEAIKKERP